MATKMSYTYFFIFPLFLSLIICHAHYSPNSTEKTAIPPLHFLKNLKGTQKGDLAKDLSHLKKYLANLGYIPTIPMRKNNDLFDDTLELAIKKYQKFYNLKITRTLNHETVKLLQQPRCGVPDIHPKTNLTASFNHNHTLYTFEGRVWPPGKRFLTLSYPSGFRTDATAPIGIALSKWMKNSPFKFEIRNDFPNSDVKVSFEKRDHGDGYPFDGPFGILAHAFVPTDGRLHFDADESWRTVRGGPGNFDLQSIALHELGHILGLGHTPDISAVMYAYFHVGQTRDLDADDIKGIQTLYPK